MLGVILAAGGAPWIATPGDLADGDGTGRCGGIARLDPSTLEITDIVTVDRAAIAMPVVADGAIWTWTNDGLLNRVDTEAAEITGLPYAPEFRAREAKMLGKVG